jgi:hypothetical protein
LISLAALPCILQNGAAPMIIDGSPIHDFADGSKAAQADVIIVEAAVAYAG